MMNSINRSVKLKYLYLPQVVFFASQYFSFNRKKFCSTYHVQFYAETVHFVKVLGVLQVSTDVFLFLRIYLEKEKQYKNI